MLPQTGEVRRSPRSRTSRPVSSAPARGATPLWKSPRSCGTRSRA